MKPRPLWLLYPVKVIKDNVIFQVFSIDHFGIFISINPLVGIGVQTIGLSPLRECPGPIAVVIATALSAFAHLFRHLLGDLGTVGKSNIYRIIMLKNIMVVLNLNQKINASELSLIHI